MTVLFWMSYLHSQLWVRYIPGPTRMLPVWTGVQFFPKNGNMKESQTRVICFKAKSSKKVSHPRHASVTSDQTLINDNILS